MNKHDSGSEWERKWWFVDRRNGVVGQKWKNSGPEKLKMDRRKMRSEWETCSENSPWASTESELGSEWIGLDRSGSEWIGVWVGIRLELGSSGSEWADRSVARERIGVSGSWADRSDDRERIVSGSECGSWADRSWVRVDRSDVRRLRRAWIVSGSEWIGTIFVECVELGSLLGHFSDRSLAASSRERIGAWQSSACVRARACERGEENNWSENNDWNQFQSFLAYFPVKLKMFSVWPNFTAQPNTRFSRNWFPEINFSRNKRSLRLSSFNFCVSVCNCVVWLLSLECGVKCGWGLGAWIG